MHHTGRNPILANQTLGRCTLRVDVLLTNGVHEGDVAGQQLRQHLRGWSDFGYGCTWIPIGARPWALIEPSDLASDLVVVSAKDLEMGLCQSHTMTYIRLDCDSSSKGKCLELPVRPLSALRWRTDAVSSPLPLVTGGISTIRHAG